MKKGERLMVILEDIYATDPITGESVSLKFRYRQGYVGYLPESEAMELVEKKLAKNATKKMYEKFRDQMADAIRAYLNKVDMEVKAAIKEGNMGFFRDISYGDDGKKYIERFLVRDDFTQKEKKFLQLVLELYSQ